MKRWLIAGGLVGLGGVAALLRPVSSAGLEAEPAAAPDYAGALERYARLRAADGPRVNPVCASRLLTHGEYTERAFVLFHGVTNCPAQFLPFGQLLHARGANVLLPRMPENGFRDRATSANRWLTAARMRAYADASVDLAAGLGKHITVVGVSSGGVLAAWCAQCRPEVDLAVPIAPALAVLPTPPWLRGPEASLLLRLPDVATARFKPFNEGPGYGYTGFSTRNLGEIMRLGFAVTRSARRALPGASRIAVVTNDDDRAVSNAVTHGLIRAWRHHGADVTDFIFPAALRLPHDLIDPHQPRQRTALVYPALLDLLGLGST